MTWELRGFAENGTILFRMDGVLSATEGDFATFLFGPVSPFTGGVLTRISITEGEQIYFAGHLSTAEATLVYHAPNDTGDGQLAYPQAALDSIITESDVISVCAIVKLAGPLSLADMSWVNNLAHGTITGELLEDLGRMAKAAAVMSPYWKSILPSVKQDQITGGHLDEMLLAKQPTWTLGMPYYGCLAWLFAHLWETRVFNTDQHQFKLNDDYTLTISHSPTLLQQHQPSRN